MSQLFENIAAADDSALIAHRQASAVANKRVKDRFHAFLANATNDLPARHALIEDEITEIVASVVSEYGGNALTIEAAIKRSLGMPGVPGAPAAPMNGQAPMGAMDPSGMQPGGGQSQTCPQCGNAMVNGQCPSCQGAGAAAMGGAAMGGAMGTHTMPQGPSSGPIQASTTAAGGYCDECKGWKHKGDCHCEAEKVDADADESGDDGDGDSGATTSSFRTARRPKLCPYHSEVIDISLGAGDPQAGFNAMSSHAWGDQHCKGGFGGSCNFRPSMVTQKHWDDKNLEYDERREQREQDRQLSDLSIDTQPIMHAEPLPVEPGKEGVSDLDGELADAPSAIGAGEMAMAASTHKEAEALKTVDLPTGNDSALGGPSPKIDKGKSGDEGGWSLEPIDTQMDGSPNPSIEEDPTAKADYTKDDFLEQTKAVTKSEKLPANKGDAGYDPERNIKQYPTKTFPKGDQAKPVTRKSESAANADCELCESRVPKGETKVVDGLRLCADCRGSDTPDEKQTSDLEREAALHGDQMHQDPGYHPDNFQVCQNCGGDHADPSGRCPHCGNDPHVDTDDFSRQLGQSLMGHGAAVDPDKNPIRELMQEYEGFLMPNQVESSIRDWEVG